MPYSVDVDDSGHMTWPPVHAESGKRLMESSQENWQRALTILATKGPLHDKSGLASNRLAKHMRWKMSSGALSNLVNAMVDAGLVTRESRGRRTFSIALAIDPEQLPIGWLPTANGTSRDAAQDHGAPETHDTDATSAVEATEDTRRPLAPAETNGHGDVDVVDVAAPDSDAWMAAMMDNGGVDYSLLATALLERVVDVVTHHDENNEDTYDRATVLSVQLTHANNVADKLRNRINNLERELAVGAGVAKSLRIQLAEERRLHAGTEANLQRVMDLARKFNPNAGMDEDHRNALAKLLREVPISPDTQRNVT